MKKKIILSIIIMTLISCQNKLHDNNDYLIINDIMKNGNTEQTLDSNKTNEHIILILEKLNIYELNGDNLKLDSLKQGIGFPKNDKILNSILNQKEYEYLISQKHVGTWGKNILNTFNTKENEHSKVIEVSKPIYSQDNTMALICINKQTKSCVYIYKKESNKWSFYKMIAPSFNQPKVKTFIK